MAGRGVRQPVVIVVGCALGVGVLCCGMTAVLGATGALDDTTSTDPSRTVSAHPRHHRSPVAVTPAAAPTAGPGTGVTDGSHATTALAALARLPVKSAGPMTGYARDKFGTAWVDTDHNGCGTRDDILRRDLTHVGVKAGTNGCVVLNGTLHDPYTGHTIHFTRGESTSSAIQIDHLVALADAWRTGAQELSAERREHLANDPTELLAVNGPTNESKGDQGAASWLPPNGGFECTYVADQIGVKTTYRLWVTHAEHDVMAATLRSCGGKIRARTHPPAPPAASTHQAPPTHRARPTRPASHPTDNGGGNDYPIVTPGAFCSASQVGTLGVGRNGHLYRCYSQGGTQARWHRV